MTFVAAVVGLSLFQQNAAKQAGFEDYASFNLARESGITDPEVWAVEGPAILAKIEAERALAEDKVKAARLTSEAEAAERRVREVEEAAVREAEAEAQRKREAEQRAARAAREREQEAAARRSGFHCLSSWDGSHRAFKNAVRDRMRDPDSFDHIETVVTPIDEDGMHLIAMQYRARNGFGGMNVGTALGQLRNSNCNVTILTID